MKINEAITFGAKPIILEKLEEMGLKSFTNVQEAAIKAGLCEGKSLVIAAPTSSGKTTIAEIASIGGALEGRKTIYLVTHRALAEEKYLSFKKNYASGREPWFDVSISTGDHTEGDWNNGILVATYEKYLSLLCSSNIYAVTGKVVVADEIQILSDPVRGPDIEILCSIIRELRPSQFIALSATTPNADEIALWFGCEHLNINYRDVRLRQEIWYNGRRYYSYYGNSEIFEDENRSVVSNNTLQAVQNILSAGLGPILVFTMTRPQARELAELFAQSRAQDASSYALSEQLDLFSEPTALSVILKGTSERKVAFHSAELSFAERAIVEKALSERKYDVVFSTPTLAAGVNFPIRTVIFDSFSRFWEASPWILKSEYLNMSGRAGRLGLDEEGMAILIARDRAESIQAREYLSADLEPLESQLLNKSVRKSVLHLISSGICKNEEELNNFYSGTFWWYQTRERNPKKLVQVNLNVSKSIEWLLSNNLVAGDNKGFFATPLGHTISATGLLPSTGAFLFDLLEKNKDAFSSDSYVLPILHAVCASDEFYEGTGQRYLPFANRNRPEIIAWSELQKSSLFVNPIQVQNYDRVTNASYGLFLWSQGIPERTLTRSVPPISYGQFHTLSSDVSWVLEGLAKIASTPGLGFHASLATKLKIFAEQIRFGVPVEAIDLFKAAKAFDVPGLGRQRATALVKIGIAKPNEILGAKFDDLQKTVESKDRAEALLEAVGKYFSMNSEYWRNRHIQQTHHTDKDRELLIASYDSLGHGYEDVIQSLLESIGWQVTKLDTGKRQGVPDFLISDGKVSALVECKTKKSQEATINKEDAFEVLIKGVDINADYRVTIGKPEFDTFSKFKAAGSSQITLVPHYAFIEGFLRWRDEKLTSKQLFEWLITPGVATIDLLSA